MHHFCLDRVDFDFVYINFSSSLLHFPYKDDFNQFPVSGVSIHGGGEGVTSPPLNQAGRLFVATHIDAHCLRLGQQNPAQKTRQQKLCV